MIISFSVHILIVIPVYFAGHVNPDTHVNSGHFHCSVSSSAAKKHNHLSIIYTLDLSISRNPIMNLSSLDHVIRIDSRGLNHLIIFNAPCSSPFLFTFFCNRFPMGYYFDLRSFSSILQVTWIRSSMSIADIFIVLCYQVQHREHNLLSVTYSLALSVSQNRAINLSSLDSACRNT